MTHSGHKPDRNPATQQSPAGKGVLSFGAAAQEWGWQGLTPESGLSQGRAGLAVGG
jgi:hypothetical protein